MPAEGIYQLRRYAYSQPAHVSVSVLRILSTNCSGDACRWIYEEEKLVSDPKDEFDVVLRTTGVVINNFDCHMFSGETFKETRLKPSEENDGKDLVIDSNFFGLDTKYLNKPKSNQVLKLYGITMLRDHDNQTPFSTRITLNLLTITPGEIENVFFKSVSTGVFPYEKASEQDRRAINNELNKNPDYLTSRRYEISEPNS